MSTICSNGLKLDILLTKKFTGFVYTVFSTLCIFTLSSVDNEEAECTNWTFVGSTRILFLKHYQYEGLYLQRYNSV
jgi:hypothetical protein